MTLHLAGDSASSGGSNRYRTMGLVAALVTAGTYAGFRGGSALHFDVGSAWPFWVSTAVTLAALLLRPPGEWPWYLAASVLGETLVILTGTEGNWTTPVIAVGNASEALAAALIVRHYSGVPFSLRSVRSVLVFVAAACLSSSIAATVGAIALRADGMAFGVTDWWKFWVGDVLGLVTVTPGLFGLTTIVRRYARVRGRRLAESLAVFALCLGGLSLVFIVQDIAGFQLHGYIALPIMAIVASRFGTTGVSATAMVLGLASVAFTVNGHGPFADPQGSRDEQVIQVQLFVFFTTVPMLLLAANVTQRRRLERERVALRERLAQSERLDSLGNLAGAVAHDFNNLLQIIMVSTDLAESQLGPSNPARGELAEIRDATRRGSDIIGQLHSLAHDVPLQSARSCPDEVISAMGPLLRRLLPSQSTLNIHEGANKATIGLNRSDIERVLTNLVVNARDALGDEGGTIELTTSVESPGRTLCIAVSDSGCGIAPEILDLMWEPFFTLKPPGKGTGLGLASVRNITHRAGGTIRVESIVGAGTTIRLQFPLLDPS